MVSKAGAAVISPVQNELAGKLAEYLAGAPMQDDSDGGARIALAILNSETLDQIADVFNGMDNAVKYMNVPLMIQSFELHESTKDGGLGVYATVNATVRSTGNSITFNCGSQAVLAVLLVTHKRGLMPFTAHIETKDTRGGNTVYNLIPDE